MSFFPRTPTVRATILWSASTVLAIPVAGYLGTAIVGRVDTVAAALAGGALVGVLVGLAQALGSSRRLGVGRWVVATTLGLGIGTMLGTLSVDFRTSLGDLAVRGVIAGAITGLSQCVALPSHAGSRWIWIPTVAALTSLGWIITTAAGVSVDQQFIIFGASGALVYAAATGLLLEHILPAALPRPSTPTPLVARP